MTKYNLSIFIFRRDLRLTDNSGLIKSLSESKKVVPIFIFTPEQVTKKNKYKSDNCIQFMIESLEDLNQQLEKKGSKLYLFYGTNKDVLKYLIKKLKVDAIYENFDYTPYATERSKIIKKLCEKNNVKYETSEDYTLTPIDLVKTESGTWFKKFTPYKNSAQKTKPEKPNTKIKNNFYTKSIKISFDFSKIKKLNLFKTNKNILLRGGRKEAQKILEKIKTFRKYKKTRDYPAKDSTTHLSAYIKFGCLSIREIYECVKSKLGLDHTLIVQLYWHDFYAQILYHYPYVIKGAFQTKFNKLKWKNDEKKFKKWKNGETGFPIVDAGMRQMNKTGWMHNRVRMIVASFLVKDLHINWQMGEKYFAQKLIDYDPSQNNGNWQWCASTGADSQPYFRIFNPWSQSKKYDLDCEYIKKWIPELKDVANKDIHKWDTKYKDYKKIKYPSPMLDHGIEAKKTIKYFSGK